jgi:hypothetical protein
LRESESFPEWFDKALDENNPVSIPAAQGRTDAGTPRKAGGSPGRCGSVEDGRSALRDLRVGRDSGAADSATK